MSMIRWEPFRAMDDMFNRVPGLYWPRWLSNNESSSEWSPAVDISETGEEYLIRAALPAVKKDDVEVTVEDGMLTLSGSRRQQQEQQGEKFHKVETFYGSFSRSFTLPDAIDAAAISAESKDGVLTIHVPKTRAEISKPKTIKVQ